MASLEANTRAKHVQESSQKTVGGLYLVVKYGIERELAQRPVSPEPVHANR